jgi:hypothetical protein
MTTVFPKYTVYTVLLLRIKYLLGERLDEIKRLTANAKSRNSPGFNPEERR